MDGGMRGGRAKRDSDRARAQKEHKRNSGVRTDSRVTVGAAPRTGQNKAQSEPADEVNWEGQPSFFLDQSQALPDDEHPVLLHDCHRSILSDYKGLGVPSIVQQIILSRTTSVGLCRGSQVPHCCTIPQPFQSLTLSRKIAFLMSFAYKIHFFSKKST